MRRLKQLFMATMALGVLFVASPAAASASVTHTGVTASVVVQDPWPVS